MPDPDRLTVMDARMGCIDVCALLPAPKTYPSIWEKSAKVAMDCAMEYEAKARRVGAALDALLIVGARMSNLMHNLSQPSWAFEERHREEMRDLYRQWDEAVARLEDERR